MQIGHKIYFELATGNIIIDVGERQGSVVETTQDQDFQAYTALQPYQQSAIGVIQCDYGYSSDNFSKYPFHIDITKNPIDETAIVWDTANPLGATLADVQQNKLSQITNLYNQKLEEGFTSSCSGTSLEYDYSPTSQTKWTKLFLSIANNVIPDVMFPLPITLKNGTVVNHTKLQLQQLIGDITVWEFQLEAKYTAYTCATGSVMSAKTIDDVNKIIVQF